MLELGVSEALGQVTAQLQQLATSLGIPMDQVANVLSKQLPAAVYQASPNGALETS